MMAALRGGGTWDSALSVDGFAAIRSAGFEPVGQVFGAAAYYLATVAGASCPGTAAGHLLRDASPEASGTPGRISGTASVHGFPGPAAKIAQGLYEGRRTAIDRMTGQCVDLGGHGIVGAALRVTEIPATSFTAAAIEFTVIGTAVRASSCPPLARPFACGLSGPDFAKLIMAGWVPAGIALGISVAGLHDDLVTTSSGRWGTGNAEVPAYTGLMIQARQDARDRLEQSVRGLGADGVVVSAMTLRVRSDACRAHPGGTDHFAEAVTTGSVVARFTGRNKTALPPSLAVVHLGADAGQRGPGSPASSAPRPKEALLHATSDKCRASSLTTSAPRPRQQHCSAKTSGDNYRASAQAAVRGDTETVRDRVRAGVPLAVRVVAGAAVGVLVTAPLCIWVSSPQAAGLLTGSCRDGWRGISFR